MKESGITRRNFLKTSTASAAAVGLSTALSYRNVLGANGRINVGVIGCGGMGSHHLRRLVNASEAGELNVKVIAVCDIYEPRKLRAKETCGGTAYHDYRKLLDNKDIDVVWIAVPDHWHARMSIDAMEAGKDIYCEKPMTRYWHEAKEVYRTVLRTRRVMQIGSQGCSDNSWKQAHELIKEGKIGKLVWAQTSIGRNSKAGDWCYHVDVDAGPHNLDWNAFLGSAPKRPFDPERFFRWRKYWDYSGGIATDLFSHVLHALIKAIGPEFPRRVVAGGGVYVHKDRETPDTFHMIADYPGEYSVVVVSSQANEQGLPVVIRGHEATMYLSGGNISIRPERIYAEDREELTVKVKPVGDVLAAHHRNFLECVRTREWPNCNAELGYKVAVAYLLSVECYRENKVKLFDPVKEDVIA